MTPSATSIPTQTTGARAEAFMYILKRGWLTQKQIEMAMEFGFAAANNSDEEAPLTPEQRAETARRHMMKAARGWERIPEVHHALMDAVARLDHAVESAK